jgi:inosine-uridine nucleoside N-ribohydrolase
MVDKIPFVIDTDVGTDVDDLFALIYALKHPNIDVKAITTVHGNTKVRANIAKKLTNLLGVNVPIFAGESGPSESVRLYWTGIEEKALSFDELNRAVEKKFPEYNENTRLVCIGPLSNIAKQINSMSSILKVKDIYIMGYHSGSHNFKADLGSAEKVMNYHWNKHLITKETSQKISLSKEELRSLRGTPLGDFLCDSAIRWLNFSGKEKLPMYDVLTVSAAAGEGYVKFKKEPERFISYDVDPALKERLLEAIRQNGR